MAIRNRWATTATMAVEVDPGAAGDGSLWWVSGERVRITGGRGGSDRSAYCGA
ncbi:hypothetical protein [Halonotius pteroides]|uniref:hypothetical protein n=1 Tax=Halonotius pteroides TaxID=268735 RepID=UPI001402ECF8|nr:hypothetical protein [Halonotius pteroides]